MMIFSIFNLYHHMGIDFDSIVRIPVSQLRNYDGEDVILPVNYPIYGLFSLSPQIHPVFLGLSILHGAITNYIDLRKYQPIGCRDLHTFRILREKGIDAYLNGCLTITLPKRERPTTLKSIYLVDVPVEVKEFIPIPLLKNIVELSQNFWNDEAKLADEDYTKLRYEEYINNAKLVVSSRLHCVLPCAAAGIPTILTVKKKSSRYNWLENIMPIYTLKDYGEINWDPLPLEFEGSKKLILEHAASRIWEEYYRLTARSQIQDIFMNDCTDYSIETATNAVSYMEKHWRKSDGDIKYVIWGVTQTAELLYDFICKNYPKAKLVGVVDMFHEQKFHGIMTSSTDLLMNDGTTVFVTAEAANAFAKNFFAEHNIKNYVMCWDNPKTNSRHK